MNLSAVNLKFILVWENVVPEIIVIRDRNEKIGATNQGVEESHIDVVPIY